MISLIQVLDDWPLWGLSTKPVEKHQLTPLIGGLTNICYRLSLDTGEYILRIGAENTQALAINRDKEKRIHQLVASMQFTSPIRYSSDDNSYWIRDYIEGEVVSESLSDVSDLSDSLLAYMIEQLKALHQIPVEQSLTSQLPPVNISDIAENYWRELARQKPDDELLKMKALMQVAMSEPPQGAFCLCHLDPVLSNWLYTPEGLKLLDWEYAGLGHPLWDLAALYQGIKESLSYNETSIQQIEDKIISLYGVNNLVAWRRANVQMEYLSSLWYRVQAD
jgi:thiamine kinase-like enzyme